MSKPVNVITALNVCIVNLNKMLLVQSTVNSSVPSTPVIDLKKAPSFTQEQPHLDAYERALRQRKQEVSTVVDTT